MKDQGAIPEQTRIGKRTLLTRDSVYVLVAIMKKQLNICASLYTILLVLSVSAFESTLLFQLLAQPDYISDRDQNDKQLIQQTVGTLVLRNT